MTSSPSYRYCWARHLVLLRSRDVPVTGDPWALPFGGLRGYGVDVPAMSLELHEWDIHIV